jgi:hypothetical protein
VRLRAPRPAEAFRGYRIRKRPAWLRDMAAGTYEFKLLQVGECYEAGGWMLVSPVRQRGKRREAAWLWVNA